MKKTTLCFLLKDDEVLLAMKKRGFGVGKWNGVGGKVSGKETVREAAAREVREEIGVTIDPAAIRDMGILTFRFKDNDEWDNEVHIFVAEKWKDDPGDSEEVWPRWFKKINLPFNTMWVDDPHWLPLVLDGKKINGTFLFDKNGEVVLMKTVRWRRSVGRSSRLLF